MHPRRAPRGKPIRLLCVCIVESICSKDDDSPPLQDRYFWNASALSVHVLVSWKVRSLSRNESTRESGRNVQYSSHAHEHMYNLASGNGVVFPSQRGTF